MGALGIRGGMGGFLKSGDGVLGNVISPRRLLSFTDARWDWRLGGNVHQTGWVWGRGQWRLTFSGLGWRHLSGVWPLGPLSMPAWWTVVRASIGDSAYRGNRWASCVMYPVSWVRAGSHRSLLSGLTFHGFLLGFPPERVIVILTSVTHRCLCGGVLGGGFTAVITVGKKFALAQRQLHIGDKTVSCRAGNVNSVGQEIPVIQRAVL